MEHSREKQERRIQVGDQKSRTLLTSRSHLFTSHNGSQRWFPPLMLQHCVKYWYELSLLIITTASGDRYYNEHILPVWKLKQKQLEDFTRSHRAVINDKARILIHTCLNPGINTASLHFSGQSSSHTFMLYHDLDTFKKFLNSCHLLATHSPSFCFSLLFFLFLKKTGKLFFSFIPCAHFK